jgi:hypothetical protein
MDITVNTFIVIFEAIHISTIFRRTTDHDKSCVGESNLKPVWTEDHLNNNNFMTERYGYTYGRPKMIFENHSLGRQ